MTHGILCRFIEVQSDYENRRKALKDLSRQPSMDGGDDTVPTAAAVSFRAAAHALRYAMTQRSGRSCASPVRRGGESEAVAPAEPEVDDDASDEELFSAMQGQWVEVECLLRVQLRSEEALEQARERVAASLAFDAALGKRAAQNGVLKGAIFQALLARADGSDSATAASVGLSMADDEWQAEAAGADALRKLVRCARWRRSGVCARPMHWATDSKTSAYCIDAVPHAHVRIFVPGSDQSSGRQRSQGSQRRAHVVRRVLLQSANIRLAQGPETH